MNPGTKYVPLEQHPKLLSTAGAIDIINISRGINYFLEEQTLVCVCVGREKEMIFTIHVFIVLNQY